LFFSVFSLERGVEAAREVGAVCAESEGLIDVD
jgi:hypothetical protein